MNPELESLLSDDMDREPAPDLVGRLGALAEELVRQRQATDDAEAEWKRQKEIFRVLREETIPDVMQEAGCAEFCTPTGWSLTVSDDVRASIPRAKMDEAIAYLTGTGNDGIIKSNVVVPFDRGSIDAARELAQHLQDQGMPANLAESVHPQTLKAWCREQLADGHVPPADVFGIYQFRNTKLVKK